MTGAGSGVESSCFSAGSSGALPLGSKYSVLGVMKLHRKRNHPSNPEPSVAAGHALGRRGEQQNRMPAAWSVQTRQTLCGQQHGELLSTLCILPEMLGGFQIWFNFHPEFWDFRIWSDTLKFQDRVKYLLKYLCMQGCWCFGERSTDCGVTAAPLLHELSGSFSLRGTAAPQLTVCLCQ